MWIKVTNETEKNIILFLNEKNPEPCSLTSIANHLSLTKPAILKQIKKLEKNGILEYKAFRLIGQRSEIKLNKRKVKIQQEYDFKKDVFLDVGPIIFVGMFISVLLSILFIDINIIYSAVAFSIVILSKTFYEIIKSPKYTNVYVNVPEKSLTKLTPTENKVNNTYKPVL